MTSHGMAVRIAGAESVCGAPGCLRPIKPGNKIIKPAPGQAWQHQDCERKSSNRGGKRKRKH